MKQEIEQRLEQKMAVISTDCVCDLPSEYVKKYEIPLMYYYIQTEEARFQDTKEMNADNLVEYMEEDGKKAYSGCASVEEYRSFFENLRKKTERTIIHICMARYVSDAYDIATMAAEGLERVYVVDCGHLSGGMGMMVLEAADMAKRGAVTELILKELESMKKRISTSFVVDSTECLYRNKKISWAVDLICSTFSLHPVLELRDGHMLPVKICIGKRQRYARAYIRWALKHSEAIAADMAFLISAGVPYDVQQYLRKEIEKKMQWKTLVLNSASATISCNCGSGAFGILFLKK